MYTTANKPIIMADDYSNGGQFHTFLSECGLFPYWYRSQLQATNKVHILCTWSSESQSLTQMYSA